MATFFSVFFIVFLLWNLVNNSNEIAAGRDINEKRT